MNRPIITMVFCFFLFSCGTEEDVNDIIPFEGTKLELRFPRVQKVEHGEYFEIDGQIFYHNKYSHTEYIAGAEEITDNFMMKNKIDLQCSKNVAYVTPDKKVNKQASSNQIAIELAVKLTQLKDFNGKSLYHIKDGPILNFEGRIILNREDGQKIILKKGKKVALIAEILE